MLYFIDTDNNVTIYDITKKKGRATRNRHRAKEIPERFRTTIIYT
jgi:hypothetical protein